MTQLILQPDATDGKDTYIYQAQVTLNFGISADFPVGSVIIGSNRRARAPIAFDLSSIPAGATITSATLSLYCYNRSDTRNIGAYRALTQWFEGAKDGAAPDAGQDGSVWNYRNANGSVEWGSSGSNPGGVSGVDWNATATAATDITSSLAWFGWDLTADVQAWFAGTATNYGWWLIDTAEAESGFHRVYFYSSDYATDASLRPKLTIEYTLFAPTAPPLCVPRRRLLIPVGY